MDVPSNAGVILRRSTSDKFLAEPNLTALKGRSALILRSAGQHDLLAELLEEEGARATTIAVVESRPPSDFRMIDEALQKARDYDWIIFTSTDAVNHLLGRLRATQTEGAHLPQRVGAIGPATRRALSAMGIDSVWTPASFTASALAREIPAEGGRVIVARADKASSNMDEILASRGIEVHRIDAYSTVNLEGEAVAEAVRESPDVIALMGPSSVRALASSVEPEEVKSLVATISPATSEACDQLGIKVTIEAESHTSDGIAQAIVAHFSDQPTAV